jgi:hypothetical protein
MPVRRGNRKAHGGATSADSSTSPRDEPGCRALARAARPTEQVDVDEQRAASHDLHQLADAAGVSAPAHAPAALTPGEGGGPLLATADEADHGGPRHKAAGRGGCSLDGGSDRSTSQQGR